MIYLIIYLIGCISAYYLSRKELRKQEGESYNWNSVMVVLICSLLSWFWVVIIWVSTDNNTYNFPKPPKWL